MKLIARSFYRTERVCGDGSYIRAICYSMEGVREQTSFDVHGLFVMRGKKPGESVFVWDPEYIWGSKKKNLYNQITFALVRLYSGRFLRERMRLRRKRGGGGGESDEMILRSKRLATCVLTAPRAPGFQTTPNYIL